MKIILSISLSSASTIEYKLSITVIIMVYRVSLEEGNSRVVRQLFKDIWVGRKGILEVNNEDNYQITKKPENLYQVLYYIGSYTTLHSHGLFPFKDEMSSAFYMKTKSYQFRFGFQYIHIFAQDNTSAVAGLQLLPAVSHCI